MCGFFGINIGDNTPSNYQIKNISKSLQHRGPDNEGIVIDKDLDFALIHRRLSIIDLSNNANQPMQTDSGRYILLFNGEIYNYLDLRNKLSQKIEWKSNSDTETLMHLIIQKGIDEALKEIHGMFAFAFIDKKKKIMFLARDRSGEKPLYYGNINNNFFFTSDLVTIKNLNNCQTRVSENKILEYFYYGFNSDTVYENIFKVDPASYLEISLEKKEKFKILNKVKYWKLNYFKTQNFIDVEKQFSSILETAVRKQMISDAPIGSLLSSGADSSLITSLMQKQSAKKIKTFTIGFENNYDESESYFAKKVSQSLGTDHNELILNDKIISDTIPKIFHHFDNPLCDSSMIPTYLACKLASNHVKVVLTGDGGDELFYGYKRYTECEKIFMKIDKMPRVFLNLINNFFRLLPTNFFRNLKIKKLSNAFKNPTKENIYNQFLLKSNFNLISKRNFNFDNKNFFLKENFNSIYDYMSYVDFNNYLPNDILYKVDRCSMANSIEARVPFLDYLVLEFFEKISLDQKVKNFKSKILIKKLLSEYLPDDLIKREKKGFGLNLNRLLKTSLKDWALQTLNDKILENDIFLDKKKVFVLWENFLNNRGATEHQIWLILSYLSWKKNWGQVINC